MPLFCFKLVQIILERMIKYKWKVGQVGKIPPVTVSSKHQEESGGDIGSIPILSMRLGSA